MTNLVVEQGAVKHVALNVLVKVETIDNVAIEAINSSNYEVEIFTPNAGINKLVLVGMDKVYTFEAEDVELVNDVYSNINNKVLSLVWGFEVPVKDYDDIMQSKLQAFELGLLSALDEQGTLLDESYSVQILKVNMDGDE